MLDGHAAQPVLGMADVLGMLAKGDAQKRRAATAMVRTQLHLQHCIQLQYCLYFKFQHPCECELS